MAIDLVYKKYYKQIAQFYEFCFDRKNNVNYYFQIKKYYLLGYQNGDIESLESFIHYLITIEKYDKMFKYAEELLIKDSNNFYAIIVKLVHSVEIEKNDDNILHYLKKAIYHDLDNSCYEDNDYAILLEKIYSPLKIYIILIKMKKEKKYTIKLYTKFL